MNVRLRLESNALFLYDLNVLWKVNWISCVIEANTWTFPEKGIPPSKSTITGCDLDVSGNWLRTKNMCIKIIGSLLIKDPV